MVDHNIVIRDANVDDVEEIAEIWRHYVRDTIVNLEETQPTTEQVRQDLSQVFEKRYPFIVAVQGSSLCGYAYIGPFNNRSGYRFCCEDSIYLQPDYTGQGLGKRLLATLIQQVRANTEMLHVMAKISLPPSAGLSTVASCRLHQSFGFTEVGRLKNVGFKFGSFLDVVMLQLSLKEGN